MLNLVNSLSRKQKVWIFVTIDLGLIGVAMLATYAVQPILIGVTLDQAVAVLPYLMFGAAIVSLLLGLPHIKLKSYERNAVGLTAIYAAAVASLSVAVAWVAGLSLPPGTYIVFGILYFLTIAATRALLFQIVSAIYRSGQPSCRVLIYGAGPTGMQLVQALRAHDSITPVAFVDDKASLQGVLMAGLPVFSPNKIAELVEQRNIHRVLLAMPSLSQPKQAQIARKLQKMGLEVQALPSFAQLIGKEELVDKLTPIAPKAFLGRATRDLEMNEACQSYTGRSILVSGAGGSIGSELCRQLLVCRPARLVLYELNELALYTIHQELTQLNEGLGIKIVPILGSVTNPQQVGRTLVDHGVQVVLHAAAYKHVPLVELNPLPGLANNVLGTQTLAHEAARAGVERFILISTDKAVRPANVMGASKRLAELVVQDLATRNTKTIFTMVRFGNVLGSSGSVIPLFQEQVSRGGPVTVTDLNVKRYFMTIQEATQLVLQAGAAARGSEVFVLDMGEPVSIIQLARQVIESAGYTVRDVETPDGDIEIEVIGLRPGEKIEEELTLSDGLVSTRHPKIFCAHEGFLSEIEIASVLKGLRETVSGGDEIGSRALIKRWVEGYQEIEPKLKTS